MGKPKIKRTEQIKRIGQGIIIAEQAQNAIEQHNFDRLVRNGVIIEAQAGKSMLNFEGAGSGKPTPEAAISTCQSLKFRISGV